MKTKKLYRFLALFFIMALVLSSLRFMLFNTWIISQKSMLRKATISQNGGRLLSLQIDSRDLFRDKANLDWKDNNRELVIDGRYYEVTGIKKAGSSYVVSLKEDINENSLFSAFFSKLGTGTDEQPDLLKLLLTLVFLPIAGYAIRMVTSKFIYSPGSISGVPIPHSFELIKPPSGLRAC